MHMIFYQCENTLRKEQSVQLTLSIITEVDLLRNSEEGFQLLWLKIVLLINRCTSIFRLPQLDYLVLPRDVISSPWKFCTFLELVSICFPTWSIIPSNWSALVPFPTLCFLIRVPQFHNPWLNKVFLQTRHSPPIILTLPPCL